jgi:hypothetical protein
MVSIDLERSEASLNTRVSTRQQLLGNARTSRLAGPFVGAVAQLSSNPWLLSTTSTSGSADEFVDYIRIPPMLEASMTAIINQTAIPRLPPTDQGFLLRILQAKLQSPSKSDGSCKTDTSAFRRAAYHGHRHIPIRPICLYMQVYQRRG